MSQKYPSNWKTCTTCSYWGGRREPDMFGEWTTVDSPSSKGKCLCQNGPWRQQEKPAQSTACSRYEKWAALK